MKQQIKTVLSSCIITAASITSSLTFAELTREQVIETVESSPAAVGIHDKSGWLGLFADKSKVEDPVGTQPHKTILDEKTGVYSKAPLDKFYETFIAPNKIEFIVKRDIVAGNEMIRDVDIVTEMGTGLVVVVPAHLRYKVIEQNGEPKIKRLAAHWELNAMIGQVLGESAGLATGAEMALRMLEKQGVTGAMGYLKGMTIGIFEAGKDKANAFAAAVNSGNGTDLKNLFHWWKGTIEYPVAGTEYSLDEFDALLGNITLTLSDLKSAGWYTSASYVLTDNGISHEGIVFFKFEPSTWRITEVRFFQEG